jgi:hypothetical protein
MGQKAVLAVTSCGGPAGSFTAFDSLPAEGVVDGEQPTRSSTATAIVIAHCLSAGLIGVPPAALDRRARSLPNGLVRMHAQAPAFASICNRQL